MNAKVAIITLDKKLIEQCRRTHPLCFFPMLQSIGTNFRYRKENGYRENYFKFKPLYKDFFVY